MAYEIQTSLIGAAAALAGAAIGGLIAWKATTNSNQIQKIIAEENISAQTRSFIDASLLKISEIAIEYPFLDNDTFGPNYDTLPAGELKDRYENFCVIVFNTLDVAFDLCKGRPDEMLKLVPVSEMVRRHHAWWLSDQDNSQYGDDFRAYIQTVIDRLRQRGDIPE